MTGYVTCDVVASQCKSPNVWSEAGALDSDGCCFCDETCNHDLETGTNCHLGPYADESESSGSCYDYNGDHGIECDIGHADCSAKGALFYWYAPGYVSTSQPSNGCCHCDASCDHSLELPSCVNGTYYGPGHGSEYTNAPTPKPVAPIDAAAATTVGVLAAGAAGVAALL